MPNLRLMSIFHLHPTLTVKASDVVSRNEGYDSNPHIQFILAGLLEKFLFNKNKNKIRKKWVKFVHQLAKLGTRTAIYYNKIYTACSA